MDSHFRGFWGSNCPTMGFNLNFMAVVLKLCAKAHYRNYSNRGPPVLNNKQCTQFLQTISLLCSITCSMFFQFFSLHSISFVLTIWKMQVFKMWALKCQINKKWLEIFFLPLFPFQLKSFHFLAFFKFLGIFACQFLRISPRTKRQT